MNPFVSLIAPLALMFPASMMQDDARVEQGRANLSAPAAASSLAGAADLEMLVAFFRPATAEQVRIEERVTIRIAPRSVPTPLMPSMFAQDFVPQRGGPRLAERKIGKCLAVAGILGVQPGLDNRLILMMRDRRTISATLSKSCQTQAYYSGFLVAKNDDGQICQGRDRLLARNGTSCTVTGFRQIVEVGN